MAKTTTADIEAAIPAKYIVTTAKGDKPAPWQFIFLNVVRGLSIMGLFLLFTSSIVTMANDINAVNHFNKASCPRNDCDYVTGSTVPNQAAGAFWAVLNRLLIMFQAIVLLLSEVGWPDQFFVRYFPILGRDFGLGALGIIQGLLGAAVLSHHVDKFSLASAFFLFSVSCLNILLGLAYREKSKSIRSIRAHHAAKKGVLPTVNDPAPGGSGAGISDKEREAMQRSDSTGSSRNGMGFGRQGEKAAKEQGYYVREPEESVPPYAPKPREPKNATSPIPAPELR
ncbi:hypothetical protein EUX98_g3734 [Antrodiella citrinella]|uniref:DUF7598 domain-containing protein n=1 Tax=Antrodiella citrinella TaxID=2447956 RepID=A0A4S4N3X9_9APHY|nr:hypothetical protein EUX98_g3734 [Antrodiella citrinella]